MDTFLIHLISYFKMQSTPSEYEDTEFEDDYDDNLDEFADTTD